MSRRLVSFSLSIQGVLFAALAALPAHAQDARSLAAPQPLVGKPCPADGSHPCAPVQERLRVDPQARRKMSPFDAPAAFAPLPRREQGMPAAHMRVNGGFGGHAPGRQR